MSEEKITLESDSSASINEPPMSYKFDCLFLRRFHRLFFQFLISGDKVFEHVLLFTFLLFLCFMEEMVGYKVGMVTSAYYKILGDKDWPEFINHSYKTVFFMASIGLIKAAKAYVQSSLYVYWRETITINIHKLYFYSSFYYELIVTDDKDHRIENPDQRITQDVSKMCEGFASIFPELLIAPFVIIYYSYSSYQISGFVGPVGCIIFFIISNIVNKFLMSPIVNLIYLQEKAEGFFRFHHMHVRTRSESIAFMDGGPLEEKIANEKLDELIKTQEKLILRQFPLGISINFADYFASLVSFFALAVPLYVGRYDYMGPTSLSQLVSQNAFISITLINRFTRLIDLSSQITVIAGTTHRISQLIESLKEKKRKYDDQQDKKRIESNEGYNRDSHLTRYDSEQLVFYELENANIQVPHSSKGNLLIAKLNLVINQGRNILIAGPSGAGKTSILRVLKGLWIESCGKVLRLAPENINKTVVFLPQKPILTSGSLLQQIIYPNKLCQTLPESDDSLIKHYLVRLGLNHLLRRIDGNIVKEVDWNWYDVLSPGEMQRIAFIRLFYHRPLLAVLDESTSAITLDMEELIYKELGRLNITIVTSGHRETLRDYHDFVIKLTENPNVWTFERIK